MALTEAQKTLLKNSGKTLAIIGKFNPQDAGALHTFSNMKGSADSQPISPNGFFEAVKPSLGLDVSTVLPMGKNLYNHYKIKNPEEASGTPNLNFQVITSDSPLLETGSDIFADTKITSMQKHGGKLMSELVENLDKLSSYSHSNFAKSIIKIARDYMYHSTFEKLEGAFSQRQWFDVIGSNYKLSSEIVKYLTCYERDEDEVLAAVRAHMNNDTSENKLKQHEQEALEESLARCKHVMKGDIKSDSVWEACTKFETNADWINNYAGHEKFGLPSLSFVGGRDFLKYYQTFLVASESVHRLVRSQTLHPYIVMWLASKYAKFDEGEFHKAAEPMFEHGIEGQGDKRIPGETFAERSQMRKQIAETEIDKDVSKQLIDDELFNEKFLEMAEERTFNALIAEKSVTAASLRDRAKKLFTMLSQLAGGTVGELYKELDAFNATFVPFYRLIKNTRANENEGYVLADFKQRLMDRIGEKARETYPGIELLIENVISNAEQAFKNNTDESLDLKAIVTREYVSAYASASKNHFAQKYLDNYDAIKSEIEDTEKLYDIVRNQQQVSSNKELVGSPVVLTVETSLPSVRRKNIKEFRSGMYEQQVSSLKSQSTEPIVRTGAKPGQFENIKNETYAILNSEGAEIAKAKFNEDATIEYSVSADKAEEFLTDDKAVLKISGEPDILMTETDFPMGDIQSFVNVQKQNEEEIKELLNDNAKLAEKQDKIVGEYSKNEDKNLTRGLRALMLTEYILAVPQSQSQLGKQDLSNGLGLMVDIVENLVDANDPKVIQDLLVRDGLVSPELSKINLSKYYPVSDGDDGIDELTDIINYQYALASELTSVQVYLQELSEIRSFMEAMSDSSINVLFLNSTIDELVQPRSTKGYLFNLEDSPPAIVYLTTQARATQSSLQNLASTFAKYAGTDQLVNFQLPIFISPEKKGLTGSIPLPIFDGDELKLDFDIKQIGSTSSAEGIVVDRFIQKNPYLLLAAAILMPDGSQNFGKVQEISTMAFDGLRSNFGLEVSRNESLVQVLKDIWTKSKKNLIDALIFTQWFNLLVADMQNGVDYSLTDTQIADKIYQLKREIERERFSSYHFAYGPDYPVVIRDSNNNFLRPEGRSAMDMSFQIPFGSKHRGSQNTLLNLPFKGLFYNLLLEHSLGSQGGGQEEAAAE